MHWMRPANGSPSNTARNSVKRKKAQQEEKEKKSQEVSWEKLALQVDEEAASAGLEMLHQLDEPPLMSFPVTEEKAAKQQQEEEGVQVVCADRDLHDAYASSMAKQDEALYASLFLGSLEQVRSAASGRDLLTDLTSGPSSSPWAIRKPNQPKIAHTKEAVSSSSSSLQTGSMSRVQRTGSSRHSSSVGTRSEAGSGQNRRRTPDRSLRVEQQRSAPSKPAGAEEKPGKRRGGEQQIGLGRQQEREGGEEAEAAYEQNQEPGADGQQQEEQEQQQEQKEHEEQQADELTEEEKVIVTSEELDSNAHEQDDEIEVLQSMFEELDLLANGAIRLKVPGYDGQWEPLLVRIRLPNTYPSHDPPHIDLYAPWLSLHRVPGILHALSELYHAAKLPGLAQGSVCLFQYISYLQEEVRPPPDYIFDPKGERSLHDTLQEAVKASVAASNAKSVAGKTSKKKKKEQEEAARKLALGGGPYTGPPITIHSGVQFTPAGSKNKFQGHVALVQDAAQADWVLDQLQKKRDSPYGRPSHLIAAWRVTAIGADKGVLEEGHDDDGDRDCGKDLATLLSVKDTRNVIVMVSVWISQKGDGRRFKHIVKAGSDQLEACGFGKGNVGGAAEAPRTADERAATAVDSSSKPQDINSIKKPKKKKKR
eukprot:gb/GEZN01003864.1/.p1 GENE.gb/GEZN01003864.1/~~gb/GEZN01003864.1/.p1  ORF type:complete len:650 (+),score=163.69 gb/GEZN01003864.1/:127-2076(+)